MTVLKQCIRLSEISIRTYTKFIQISHGLSKFEILF